jgi:hypothetical protein
MSYIRTYIHTGIRKYIYMNFQGMSKKLTQGSHDHLHHFSLHGGLLLHTVFPARKSEQTAVSKLEKNRNIEYVSVEILDTCLILPPNQESNANISIQKHAVMFKAGKTIHRGTRAHLATWPHSSQSWFKVFWARSLCATSLPRNLHNNTPANILPSAIILPCFIRIKTRVRHRVMPPRRGIC